MKNIIIILLSFSIGVCSAQKKKDTVDFVQGHWDYSSNVILRDFNDSLTANRFFDDSLGNHYMIEYRYVYNFEDTPKDSASFSSHLWNNGATVHTNYIALCSIIKFKGNKQQVVRSGIKAIYSPTDCSADNSKLWLTRLYDYQKMHKAVSMVGWTKLIIN